MNTKETRRSKPRSKLFPSPNGKVIPLSENASELLKRQFERTHILDSRFFPEFEKESEYEHFSRMVEIMRDAEISSHIIYAYVKTGRMVTEENIQFLSEEDIDEWNHFINESEKFEGDFNNLIENALCELSTDISCPDLPKEALELLFDIYKFHPILVERCRDTFVSNIMIDTVRNGIMAILAEIKDVTGRFDLDGSDLINCVFSPNKPILETGMYSLGDINEQKGVHYIFLGFILAIRNQFFHRDIYLKNPYLVLQYLSYSKRTGKLRRSFLKTSISVDTIKKVILGWKISQKTDHDVKHAKTLIRQSNRSRKSRCYVMDKGYDSEEIHTLIREEIKADSIVPLRERKRKRINGKYRKQLNKDFDKIKYNRRNIVETIISVVKRKFGETLRARKVRNQVKEVKVKLIVYNINKKVIQLLWIKLRISTEPIFL